MHSLKRDLYEFRTAGIPEFLDPFDSMGEIAVDIDRLTREQLEQVPGMSEPSHESIYRGQDKEDTKRGGNFSCPTSPKYDLIEVHAAASSSVMGMFFLSFLPIKRVGIAIHRNHFKKILFRLAGSCPAKYMLMNNSMISITLTPTTIRFLETFMGIHLCNKFIFLFEYSTRISIVQIDHLRRSIEPEMIIVACNPDYFLKISVFVMFMNLAALPASL
jgi:hypothetical protein